MKGIVLLPALLALAWNAPAMPSAGAKIKIDTVEATYTPHAGTERAKPIHLQDFYFQLNKDGSRVRVVVEYTYAGAVGDHSSGDPGPRTTEAQIPGLIYDPTAQAVLYEEDGKKTVCGVVRGKSVKNTGACVVTTTTAEHLTDDGWNTHKSRALDVYFEVRP